MFGFTQSPAACCQKSSASTYRSHFCGLSCRLRKDYGHSARFLVNRDSSFLSILGSALAPDSAPLTTATCCNPLATPTPLAIDSSVQQFSAAVAVCGLTAKCSDDAVDEKRFHRMAASSLLALTNNWKDKAIATLNTTGFPTKQTLSTLSRQAQIEEPAARVQAVAEPTALAYSNIFSHLGTILSVPQQRPLAELGHSLGSLIYYRDAADDLQKDQKNGRYNPLLYRPLDELKEAAEQAFLTLKNALSSLPLNRHQQLVTDIVARTESFHADLVPAPTNSEDQKQKKDRNCLNYCDCCDCDCCDCIPCGAGSSLTCSSISCSPAESGSSCCDSCNCCDSCDCCPCN
ncbi:hypothetical protein Rhal01_01236 [Rubritalea halochordaticola]|uniref:Uncharacterized protein n=1 Tax=Rubritalea halochordaticola TaxID=714537 RepID=A0ABP9V1V2_9BACT